MKKILYLLLLPLLLFGDSYEIEKKIYSAIIESIFGKNVTIKLWSDKEEKQKFFQQLQNVVVVQQAHNADMVIIYSQEVLPYTKAVIFAGSYRILKHYKDKAVGGFYWQKGRPNLLFLKENLHKLGIQLPPHMHQYIEESGL